MSGSISSDAHSQTVPKRGVRFWLIIVSLCLSAFCTALDFVGTGTALPTIVNELHGADFSWAGTSYAIAATAFLPLTGGLSEVSSLQHPASCYSH